MKGLLRKDIKIVLYQYKILALMLAMLLGFSLWRRSLGFYSSMEPVLAIMVPMLAFGSDSKFSWDEILALFPNGRAKAVGARYLLGLLAIAAVALLHLAIGLLLRASWGEILDTLAVSAAVSLAFMAVMFPVVYKLGPEKSNMVFLLLFVGMLALTASRTEEGSYLVSFGLAADALIALGTAALMGLSSLVSAAICKKAR